MLFALGSEGQHSNRAAGTAHPSSLSWVWPAPTTQQERAIVPQQQPACCSSMAHMRSAGLAQHNSGTCSCMQQGTDRGRQWSA